jgi:hypothetical protein
VAASPREIFSAIFRPHRVAWRTLAAVWIALLVFQLTIRSGTLHPTTPAPSPELVAAWFSQFSSNETLSQVDHLR